MKKAVFIAGILLGFAAQGTQFTMTQGPYGSGVISIPCSFDSNVAQCTLDTGSDRSNVKNVGSIVNYPSQGKSEQSGVSGVVQTCDWVQIQQLTVGDFTLPPHQAARCYGNNPGYVIGMDVFHGRTLGLNFQSKLIEVSYNPIPLNLKRQSFWFSPGGSPLVAAQVDGLELQALWDTGAGLSVVDLYFANTHPDLFTKSQLIPNGMDSNGNPVSMTIYQLKKMNIGTKGFENITFVGIDLSKVRVGLGHETNLILGYNIISQANWYIDTRTRTWSVY